MDAPTKRQTASATPQPRFDLIIRGGTVVDGTGAEPVRADVGVIDDQIGRVGDLREATAADEIEARGLLITPGFIDVHSHSDLTLLIDGRAQSAISQGVTTELVGNCGHGCSPMGESPTFAANIFGYDPSIPLNWRTTAEYLSRLEEANLAINAATLVPLGNLRLATMTDPEAVSRPAERSAMRALLAEGLEAGAFGFSSGLQYPDSVATSFEELVDLTREVARRDRLYAACVRYTDKRAVLGITEPIQTAERTGARVQISHAMPMPGSPSRMTERTFELVEKGRKSGVDVAFDMHTRSHGELNISAMLPLWAVAGDTSDIARRLANTGERTRIKEYPGYVRRFVENPGPEQMVIALTRDTRLVGRTLAELTPADGDPMDTLLDILASEVDDIHRPLVLINMYPEDDLAAFYQNPMCAIASDATTLSPDGRLANAVFYGAYTWASWFMRRVVRERSSLPLPEAIRRVTSLPAQRIGLADRGAVRDGAKADLAVFDFDAVSDHGTLHSPNVLATGAVHVLVNGVPAIRDSTITAARTGRVLRSP